MFCQRKIKKAPINFFADICSGDKYSVCNKKIEARGRYNVCKNCESQMTTQEIALKNIMINTSITLQKHIKSNPNFKFSFQILDRNLDICMADTNMNPDDYLDSIQASICKYIEQNRKLSLKQETIDLFLDAINSIK